MRREVPLVPIRERLQDALWLEEEAVVISPDTRKQLLAVIETALRRGPSYVTPGGVKHWPPLDAFRALTADYEVERDALKEALEREKASHDALADAVVRTRHAIPESHDFDLDIDRPGCPLCTAFNEARWLVASLRIADIERASALSSPVTEEEGT